MLRVYSSFDSYTPWSGAVDTYRTIERNNRLEDLETLLDELYPEGIGETELNDILWFDDEWILEQMGIEND